MSRIDAARLADIDEVLDEVRSWSGIEERGGGTFYLRRRPFLHFHAGVDRRRADIRTATGWVELDLPEPADSKVKQQLLATLTAERAERA